MVGHLLFEGGSTTHGAGDAERRGGYTGRLSYHYADYNEQLAIQGLSNLYPFIYTHNNGVSDSTALKFVHTLPHSIDKARKLVWGADPEELRIVGVFAIGGTLDTLAYRFGTDELLDKWGQALNKIKAINEEKGILPIYIRTPFPDESTLFKGRPVNLELRDKQAELTTAVLPDCISFESMLGPEIDRQAVVENGPIHWGVHPNARGYDIIAKYLTPIIDAKFGIDSRSLLSGNL